jgi:hypothetical protein
MLGASNTPYELCGCEWAMSCIWLHNSWSPLSHLLILHVLHVLQWLTGLELTTIQESGCIQTSSLVHPFGLCGTLIYLTYVQCQHYSNPATEPWECPVGHQTDNRKVCKGVFSVLLEMPLTRERLAALWLILVGHNVHQGSLVRISCRRWFLGVDSRGLVNSSCAESSGNSTSTSGRQRGTLDEHPSF